MSGKDDSEHPRRGPFERYAVGYGKPPVTGQFVKGQSGNPKGRPRKPKRSPLLQIAAAEADEPTMALLASLLQSDISVRQGESVAAMPRMEAILLAQANAAMKGNRLAAKWLFGLMREFEAAAREQRINWYFHWEKYKAEKTAELAKCCSEGQPDPDFLPHPDDIILESGFNVRFIGPISAEDLKWYVNDCRQREFWLMKAAHDHKLLPPARTSGHANGEYRSAELLSQLFDAKLPPRMQWDAKAARSRLILYWSMSLGALTTQLDAAWLELTHQPPPPKWPLTPMVSREGAEMIARGMMGKLDRPD